VATFAEPDLRGVHPPPGFGQIVLRTRLLRFPDSVSCRTEVALELLDHARFQARIGSSPPPPCDDQPLLVIGVVVHAHPTKTQNGWPEGSAKTYSGSSSSSVRSSSSRAPKSSARSRWHSRASRSDTGVPLSRLAGFIRTPA